jgi:hypothetical protein
VCGVCVCVCVWCVCLCVCVCGCVCGVCGVYLCVCGCVGVCVVCVVCVGVCVCVCESVVCVCMSLSTHEHYALLGSYATSSSNSLPKFRDNLSIPSSKTKNPRTTHFRKSKKTTKFFGNPSSGSRADTRRQTDRHDDANKHFLRLSEKHVKIKS